jgi:phosphoribosylanthranilate isomerase
MTKLKPRFFVVIHALTHGCLHVLQQAEIAQQNGADGVFIIPDYEKGEAKKAKSENIVCYIQALKNDFPDFLIGVNFLSRTEDIPQKIYELQPNMIQSDGIFYSKLDESRISEIEVFCGMAFKYSKNVDLKGEMLKKHCEEVAVIADVPTTSGSATGKSADIAKIQEIRSYVPVDKRLGIASGVSIENIEDYLKVGVTDFLVATSLIDRVDSKGFDLLDPKKVSQMASIISKY